VSARLKECYCICCIS